MITLADFWRAALCVPRGHLIHHVTVGQEIDPATVAPFDPFGGPIRVLVRVNPTLPWAGVDGVLREVSAACDERRPFGCVVRVVLWQTAAEQLTERRWSGLPGGPVGKRA